MIRKHRGVAYTCAPHLTRLMVMLFNGRHFPFCTCLSFMSKLISFLMSSLALCGEDVHERVAYVAQNKPSIIFLNDVLFCIHFIFWGSQ